MQKKKILSTSKTFKIFRTIHVAVTEKNFLLDFYVGLSGSKFSFAFLSSVRFRNYAVLLTYFAIWTARYGFHVHYYGFQIRHFMITNCNGPFEFSLLLLYFVFLLRYLITNCFFC